MKKISIRRILKNISYIVMPILVAVIIINGACLAYVDQYGLSNFEEESYFQSQLFQETLYSELESIKSDINEVENYESTQTSSYYYYGVYNNGTLEYNDKEYKLYLMDSSVDTVIINEKELIMYIASDYMDYMTMSVSKMIDGIINNDYILKYENGVLETNFNKLEEQSLNWLSIGDFLKNGEYNIYMGINEELGYSHPYKFEYTIYDFVRVQHDNAIFNIVASSIGLVICIILIIIGIGRKGGKEGITLGFIDKIPLEIMLVVCIIVYSITFSIGSEITYNIYPSEIVIFILFHYIFAIILFETFIKRITSKAPWKTTLMYWGFNKLRYILSNIRERYKIFIVVAVISIAIIILAIIGYTSLFLTILGTAILSAVIMYYVLKKYDQIEEMKDIIRKIHENKEVKINTEKYNGELKICANQLMDISNGFSIAIDEQIKSEKMKTELITNVSHDIKTPLTSIINYVDLLKKENIENEKCKEYIEILESKSFRLKKLTEDLVEASKASSGNIDINLEKLELVQFIDQITSEFQEKFSEKNLSINMKQKNTYSNNSDEKIYVLADSKYLYRVFDNIYSNIYKYALEGTRVYIEISEKEKNIEIEIKNIAKNKLQKDSKELLQRFTREDKSRNTEGSGLGLSIVENLVRLQSGEFKINIDGDMFKNIIILSR